MRTATVQTVNVDDPTFEPWYEPASERGFESVAAVPLHYNDSVYGVLVVYATREDAFSPREQAGFDVLGRTVGSVIHAARSRELLFADAVVELEFHLGEAATVLVAAANELDCTMTLDGYVPSGERWVLYVTVEGAEPGSVVDRVTSDPNIERGRVVTADEGEGRVELVAAESSLLHGVTDVGATVRTATATRGDGRRRGPRERCYPGHHRRHREPVRVGRTRRPPRTRQRADGPGSGGFLDDLTDRQREDLEAAYQAGYFEWPRESSAEDVADTLGLARPTVQAHLRKAEGTILAALLGE